LSILEILIIIQTKNLVATSKQLTLTFQLFQKTYSIKPTLDVNHGMDPDYYTQLYCPKASPPKYINNNYKTTITPTIIKNILLFNIPANTLISSLSFLAFKKLNIIIQTKALNTKVKCLDGPII
jgi:hypothetical protein